MMDHPNIAKVFDGGVTESGRPFFVMEYVKGIPFTEYCDKAKLSLQDRLQLFIPICQAVQHAHHKGIVHRDLKPSNILLCLYDGKAVPKVIDFGLAKAMHQPLTDMSIYTNHGMMVGTPLYMSPEQAELNNLDVDTRTDVYSLGVVLYELLTGTTPLERQQLHAAAYNEVLRLIKEVEPQRPSMKLSGSASLPSVAAQRSIEPKELRRTLAGDLDWIVMKALEKERSRRYETANGLARDIERFLNEEAVEACPPSSTYRLKKIFKKHRGKVIAAGLFATTLLFGIIGTTFGYIAASRSAQKLKESNAALRDFSNGMLEVLEHGFAEAEASASQNGHNVSWMETPGFKIKAVIADKEVVESSSEFTSEIESQESQSMILAELDNMLQKSLKIERETTENLQEKSYRVGLQAAYTAIENGELKSAQSWLNDLPEKLRGWEWNWLMAETDKSLFRTPIPDGKTVVATSRDGLYCVLKDQHSTTELQVMDSKTGKLTYKIVLPEAKRILGVALSKDASLCIVCAALELDSSKGLRSTLFVWDTNSEKVIRRYDSGFDLNNFLFTIGILECSDSGRQFSASCYGQLGRALDEMTSQVIQNFNVMSDYAVFDLDLEDSTPTFYGEVSLGPDGTVYTTPKLPPTSTPMIVQHTEASKDEVCTGLKFSPDGSTVYRCLNDAWNEVHHDGSRSNLGEIQDFEFFEFYDRGGVFAGVKDGFLIYNTSVLASEFKLGPVENAQSVYIDNVGHHCIVYCDDSIDFFPLPNRQEIDRLKSLQFTSRSVNENLIGSSILPISPAEIAGMSSVDSQFAKLFVYRNATSMAEVSIHKHLELMRTTKNGYMIGFDESECFLQRLRISSPESYKRTDRVKVLDTLPDMSHYSNPNREYPVSSIASDDGRFYLTVLAPKQSARLFECESGKLVWEKDNLGDEVKPLFVDDQVAVFHIDSSLQRFELKGDEVLRFDAPAGIAAASVSPDNKLIACVSAGSVLLIDTVTMEEINRWSIPQLGAYSIEWGLNGARLFVYSNRSTCICDPSEGSVILNFSIDQVDDHNLTPQTDLGVFGGRIVSSRPFREHWNIWHETWQKEDAKENKTQAVQLLTKVLSQSKGLYDNWSEFKDLTNQKVLSEPGLMALDRLSAITTLATVIKFFNLQDEKLTNEVREEYVEQITKHATEELQLDEPTEKIYRQLAAVWFDCRTSLNDRAWVIVKHPNKTAREYADGLLLATEAVKRSRNHAVLNTLAVAQYRNSQYTECLTTLAEASKALGSEQKSYPSDTLFEAMANFRLGNIQKAQSILTEFRSRPLEDLNDEDRAFLKEAMELMDKDP